MWNDDAYHTLRDTPGHKLFAERRDLLVELRTDLDAARQAFAWPRPETFNWALEWFDVVGRDSSRAALELLERDGGSRTVSYDELSRRSDQVANWLGMHGVRRGDRVLVVLGAQVELWETLLACLKTGAVVIPAVTVRLDDVVPPGLIGRTVRIRITDEWYPDGLDTRYRIIGVNVSPAERGRPDTAELYLEEAA